MSGQFFVNRRKGNDRREDDDPCKDLDVDLYHRKRRKKAERRQDRTLDEDYYAFMHSQGVEDDQTDDKPQH